MLLSDDFYSIKLTISLHMKGMKG